MTPEGRGRRRLSSRSPGAARKSVAALWWKRLRRDASNVKAGTYRRRPSIRPLARAGVQWLERACMIGKSGWRAARVSSLPVGACALNATACARPNHKEQELVRRCLFRHRESLGPCFRRSSALCTQSRPCLQCQRAPSTGRELLVVVVARPAAFDHSLHSNR